MTTPLPPGINEEWRTAIRLWATDKPLIIGMWFFGSRAIGNHRPDSDLDVAYTTAWNGDESPYTVAFFNRDVWAASLQVLLSVPLDFRHADPDEDERVWPAVLAHGIHICGGNAAD